MEKRIHKRKIVGFKVEVLADEISEKFKLKPYLVTE